jgi:hypothetical protein
MVLKIKTNSLKRILEVLLNDPSLEEYDLGIDLNEFVVDVDNIAINTATGTVIILPGDKVLLHRVDEVSPEDYEDDGLLQGEDE